MNSESKYQVQLGISPISWRNEDDPEIGKKTDYRQILDEVALAGYQGTEGAGYFPAAQQVKAQADLRTIKIAGQWFSSYILRDGIQQACLDFERHCQKLAIMHAHFTVLSEQTNSIQRQANQNIFTDKPIFTDEQWQQLCAGLNEFGHIAQKYDVQIAYHHHLGTGVQTMAEVARLMDHTDPHLVGLLLDTGHAFVSDGSYQPLLEQYAARIVYLHLKDVHLKQLKKFQQTGSAFGNTILNDTFTVPGQGDLDFQPVFDFIQHGYHGWVMVDAELNPAHVDSLALAIKAHDFLSAKLTELN